MLTGEVARQAGFTLAELGPIATAYVAGSLDDARQRELLVAKLSQIEDKRQQLDQMSEFLRAKLDDLKAARQHECGTARRTPRNPRSAPGITGSHRHGVNAQVPRALALLT